MADAYWAESDIEVIKGDDFTVTQTWTTTAGVPADISTWTFAFEANESVGTGNIAIADGSMTKSNSGSGVVDTVAYTITAALSAAANEGRYKYDTSVTIAGAKATYHRGTLTIQPSEQD